MSTIINPTNLTNLNATSPFHLNSTSIPFAANTTIFSFNNSNDTAAPAAPGEDAVHAITTWWPTANIVLGALGAVAALSLAIYQIRLARRQLHATHRAANDSSDNVDGAPLLSS